MLDLRLTDWRVRFWLAQSLGSQFQLETAPESAHRGSSCSRCYGPWSLENAFVAKACFFSILMLREELPWPHYISGKINRFWRNGPPVFPETGPLSVQWRCTGYQTGIQKQYFAKNTREWFLGGYPAAKRSLPCFLQSEAFVSHFSDPTPWGLNFVFHKSLHESCTGRWKGRLSVLRNSRTACRISVLQRVLVLRRNDHFCWR